MVDGEHQRYVGPEPDPAARVGSASGGALFSTDWRDTTSSPASAAVTIRPARQSVPDPLHTRARAATPAQERARAAELVATAKTAIRATFDDVRFSRQINIADLSPIVGDIEASLSRNPVALPSVTRLRRRHEYTYIHSVSVSALMIGLAHELGLGQDEIHDVGLAGLVHDVGKARVPTALLDKPGPLTASEFGILQTHPERGHALLIAAGVRSPIALDVSLHHHERVGGGGYPAGLVGAEISIFARIAAICDVFDAVTSVRAYKNAWSPGQAIEWMTSATGHFDARMLAVFSAMIGAFPAGTLVRLQSDKLAVVLDDPSADPIRPALAIFHCAASVKATAWRRSSAEVDPIVGVERADRWAFADWIGLRASILTHFAAPARG